MHWGDFNFVICFVFAGVMGVVLNFSIFLCTNLTSALTLTVIACMKNILIAYVGVLGLGGDYVFSWLNFNGLNVSIIGSLLYSYAEFIANNAEVKQAPGGKEDKKE